MSIRLRDRRQSASYESSSMYLYPDYEDAFLDDSRLLSLSRCPPNFAALRLSNRDSAEARSEIKGGRRREEVRALQYKQNHRKRTSSSEGSSRTPLEEYFLLESDSLKEGTS